MEMTQGSPLGRVGAEQGTGDGDVDTAAKNERQRTTIRRLSWAIAWIMPVVALIVGIALTSAGAIEQWTPTGEDAYDVTMLAVWPAGLVLLGVGALGVIAAAISTAALTTKR